MPDNNEIKQQQPRPRNKKYMLVRHGRMRHIGLFEHNESEIPKTPAKVVVKTDKGLELGEVVGHLTCYKGGRFKLDGDQVDEYFKVSEIDISCKNAGKLIRYASEDDLSEALHFQKILKHETSTCAQIAKELNLALKVVEAEHIIGGERIIFYFMAEGRIDFRELVRRLSHEFQTRIEMRQIGARDEAKLLGDVESCGQQICCRRHLKYLKPVNMRMAKTQKATLDPAKISGYCGRLKCCLRYEDETYTELKRKLPKRNMMVRTPDGEGRVIDTQILTQLVIVDKGKGEREAVSVDDIQVLGPAPRHPQSDGDGGVADKNPRPGISAPAKTEDVDKRGSESKLDERPDASRSSGERTEEKPEENKDRPDKRRRRRGGSPGRRRSRNAQGRGEGTSTGNASTPGKAGNQPKPAPEKTDPHDA